MNYLSSFYCEISIVNTNMGCHQLLYIYFYYIFLFVDHNKLYIYIHRVLKFQTCIILFYKKKTETICHILLQHSGIYSKWVSNRNDTYADNCALIWPGHISPILLSLVQRNHQNSFVMIMWYTDIHWQCITLIVTEHTNRHWSFLQYHLTIWNFHISFQWYNAIIFYVMYVCYYIAFWNIYYFYVFCICHAVLLIKYNITKYSTWFRLTLLPCKLYKNQTDNSIAGIT